MLHALILCLLLLLSACATASDRNWPSLARRPSEQVAAGLASEPATAGTETSAPAAPSGVATVAVARIDDAGRELTAIEGRWTRQRTATDSAVAAAQGAARQSDAWSNAELERSRLAKVGAQAADARERLNGIAGDLATAAAAGADVAASLVATGKLIERANTLTADHAKALAALQGR